MNKLKSVLTTVAVVLVIYAIAFTLITLVIARPAYAATDYHNVEVSEQISAEYKAQERICSMAKTEEQEISCWEYFANMEWKKEHGDLPPPLTAEAEAYLKQYVVESQGGEK